MWDVKIGDKVVCINDDFSLYEGKEFVEQFPVKDGIYTVTGIVQYEFILHLTLVEISNPMFFRIYKSESSFNIARFRPIKDTNIDVFRNLLTDPPSKPDDEEYLPKVKEEEYAPV